MLTAKVTKVIDGDTFRIQLLDFEIPCRIGNIDTPERGKPHYQESKKYLTNLIEGQDIQVEVKDQAKQRDARNRFVIIAKFQNERLDEKLVREGMAWHYEKYSDNDRLIDAENYARENAQNLWSKEFIREHYCKKCESQRT